MEKRKRSQSQRRIIPSFSVRLRLWSHIYLCQLNPLSNLIRHLISSIPPHSILLRPSNKKRKKTHQKMPKLFSIPLSHFHIYPLLPVHPSLTTVCHRLDLASTPRCGRTFLFSSSDYTGALNTFFIYYTFYSLSSHFSFSSCPCHHILTISCISRLCIFSSFSLL